MSDESCGKRRARAVEATGSLSDIQLTEGAPLADYDPSRADARARVLALADYDPRRADARARVLALGWETLNARALSRPKDGTELRRRLALNLPLYAPVYGTVTSALLLVSAFTNPILLASWVLVSVAWGAYGVWGDPMVESRAAGMTVSPMEKALLLIVANLVAFVWGGLLTSVAWVGLVGLIGATTHAAARGVDDPSVA